MIVYHFDGSCYPTNPGHGGYGATCDGPEGGQLWEEYRYLGNNVTNNIAEFEGLIACLRHIKSNNRSAIIYGDSQLVINGMSKGWKFKTSHLRELAKEAKAIAFGLSIQYEWIPREKNGHADGLADQGSHNNDRTGYPYRLYVERAPVQRHLGVDELIPQEHTPKPWDWVGATTKQVRYAKVLHVWKDGMSKAEASHAIARATRRG